MTCCPLRNPSTGLPLFGISLLTPGSLPAQPSSSTAKAQPSSLHPLLNFLGLSDQELQDQIKKGHSYAFNMGNNNIIPFSDFHSAARALMERNMPEVLHNRQTKAEFLPETHLPNMPRVVDEQEYQTRKEQLDSSTLQLLRMKQGTEDSQVAQGDLAEKELSEELHSFYKNKKVVVFWGPKLRVPGKRGGHQEFDFVIVDEELKTIIGIESKITLSARTGQNASAQTKKLKDLLEQYFKPELASNDWCFVAMVRYNSYAFKQPVCPNCSPFAIHGASQLATKLASLETHLRALRPQWTPSHHEYVSLLQGLSFVVLSQPISTRCTIAKDVSSKVLGKAETSSSKAKVGQGDYKSIIFWTYEQSKVMMWEQRFVVFTSPWSTGKTICQREKARLWANENPDKKLYFCVVRDQCTTNKTLLELELEAYFHEHNALNVTVLGLRVAFWDTLSALLSKMVSLPAGSWMVDELVIPRPSMHNTWSGELQQMRSHQESQHGGLLLWISIAGICQAKPKYFRRKYLASLISGFHMPFMDIPLRNTTEVLKLVGLGAPDPIRNARRQRSNRIANITDMRASPLYTLPPHLMSGIQCQQMMVKKDDKAKFEAAVETACNLMLERSGGSGFPVFIEYHPVQKSNLLTTLQRVVGPTLLYTYSGKEKNAATEAEVVEWMRRWKADEEKRILVVDQYISRGWETSNAIAIGATRIENLVMRKCGFCVLIKQE